MADLTAAARVLRTAAGAGSSDPAPRYVKVDPDVVTAVADHLETVRRLLTWPIVDSDELRQSADALAAAILGGNR